MSLTAQQRAFIDTFIVRRLANRGEHQSIGDFTSMKMAEYERIVETQIRVHDLLQALPKDHSEKATFKRRYADIQRDLTNDDYGGTLAALQDQSAGLLRDLEAAAPMLNPPGMDQMVLEPDSNAAESARYALQRSDKFLAGQEVTDAFIQDSLAQLGDARIAYWESGTEAAGAVYDTAKFQANAALCRQKLEEVLAPGGLLTKSSPTQVSDAARANLIAAYHSAPAVADRLLKTCKNSPHLEAVAEKFDLFAGAIDTIQWASLEEAEWHIGQLLYCGAQLGSDYLDGALNYLNNSLTLANESMGWHTAEEGNERASDTLAQVSSKRCVVVSDAMFNGPDGTLDPSTEAASTVMDDLRF